jgi:hypothetical protein
LISVPSAHSALSVSIMTRTATLEVVAPVHTKQKVLEEPLIPFTLQTLRSAIPSHCLVKDTSRSLFYMMRDFAFIAICYAVYPYINANNGAFNPCMYTILTTAHSATP